MITNNLELQQVKVLHNTRHKIGQLGDITQANLLAWYGETEPNNKRTHSPIKRNVLQLKMNPKNWSKV